MNTKTKKSRFGNVPDRSEKSNNLEQPEHAPQAPEAPEVKTKKRPARKTGRTEAFGTRVTPKFNKDFKQIAFKENLKKVELLELLLENYKQSKGLKG